MHSIYRYHPSEDQSQRISGEAGRWRWGFLLISCHTLAWPAQQPIKLLQISITFKDRIFIFKKKLVHNHVFLRSKIHWQEQRQIRNCLLHLSCSFVCWWLILKCIMAFYHVGRFEHVWWHHLVLRLFCGADLQHFLWNLPKMDC